MGIIWVIVIIIFKGCVFFFILDVLNICCCSVFIGFFSNDVCWNCEFFINVDVYMLIFFINFDVGVVDVSVFVVIFGIIGDWWVGKVFVF